MYDLIDNENLKKAPKNDQLKKDLINAFKNQVDEEFQLRKDLSFVKIYDGNLEDPFMGYTPKECTITK